MQIDSASLLINAALITIGTSAVGFLVWFLIALTMEKNGAHVRCRMEFKMDEAATTAIRRQSIREVASPRPWLEGLDSAPLSFRPAQVLVTHRILRAVGDTAKGDIADESLRSSPYLIH